MTLKTVMKPTSGLTGKEYALHVESNLLVMKDPSFEDVKACRGILIETTKGWEWYTGRAFLDLMAQTRKNLGREPTFVELKTAMCRKRHYIGVSANIRQSSDVTVGIARATAGFMPDEVPQTFVAAYAVPHRSFSGRGASNIVPAMIALTGPTWDLLPGTLAKFAGPRGFTCGPVAPDGAGYGKFEPVGWMLGAAASNLTYAQTIEKIIGAMEDTDNIRAKVRTGVLNFLKKIGVDANSYVMLPYFVTHDGRVATDFAMAYPNIETRSGVTVGGGLGGDKIVPLLAGRLCFGEGDFESFPLARGVNILTSNEGVWTGYSRPTGTKGSLDQVTTPLKKTVGSLETSGIMGCQPFGAFFALNGLGAYSPKLLDEGAMSDNDWLQWAKFGFDKDASKTKPDAETPTSSYEQQGNRLIDTITTTGGREERAGFTAADTWMITVRQLVRLCWDPVVLEGGSGAWLESKANAVLATPMADGSTNTNLVTV